MLVLLTKSISKPKYYCNLAKLLYFFRNMFFNANVVVCATMCIRSHLCYKSKPRVPVLSGGHFFWNICPENNQKDAFGYQENIVKMTHKHILPFKRYFIVKVFVIQFMMPMFCPWLYLWYRLVLSHVLSSRITSLENIVFRKNKHFFSQLHSNLCYDIDCVWMAYQNIQKRRCEVN